MAREYTEKELEALERTNSAAADAAREHGLIKGPRTEEVTKEIKIPRLYKVRNNYGFFNRVKSTRIPENALIKVGKGRNATLVRFKDYKRKDNKDKLFKVEKITVTREVKEDGQLPK